MSPVSYWTWSTISDGRADPVVALFKCEKTQTESSHAQAHQDMEGDFISEVIRVIYRLVIFFT